MKIKEGDSGWNMGPLILWVFVYRLEAPVCGHIRADRIYIPNHTSPTKKASGFPPFTNIVKNPSRGASPSFFFSLHFFFEKGHAPPRKNF